MLACKHSNSFGVGEASHAIAWLLFCDKIAEWHAEATALLRRTSDPGVRRDINARLRRLARILVPINYSRGERFDHDPAVKPGVVPRLEAALQLASASPAMRPFIATGLVRERNKLRAMIRAARRELS